MKITGLQQWIGGIVIDASFLGMENAFKVCSKKSILQKMVNGCPKGKVTFMASINKKKDWNFFFICLIPKSPRGTGIELFKIHFKIIQGTQKRN